jgi:hypothetical protein
MNHPGLRRQMVENCSLKQSKARDELRGLVIDAIRAHLPCHESPRC